MKLIVLVTSKLDAGLQVANAWREAGAPGVTIIPSYGLHSLREEVKRGAVELPMHVTASVGGAMDFVLRQMQHTNHVIFSIAPADKIEGLLKAAENELGDLLQPDTGVAFVIPLDSTLGVIDHDQRD